MIRNIKIHNIINVMEKPNKCIEKYGQMFSSFSQAFSMPKVVWKIKVLKKGITLNMP